jgi:hypothetical protein
MPAVRTTVLIMLMLSCGACVYLRPKPTQATDPAAVRELIPVQLKLQAADAASAHLLLTEVGRTGTAGFNAPIWRIAYRPFQEHLKRVLVVSGIHGNETAGVDYVLELIQSLTEPARSAAGYDLDVLPLVNPWGYVHDRTFSANGVDIGRDFTDFDSHEAKVVRRFLRGKRYDLVIDLREDPQAAGFCLWRYGPEDAGVSERIVGRIRAAGYPIQHEADMLLLKPRNGIVDAPMWGLTVLRLFRQLTIAGYMRRNVSSDVFTVVTPAALALNDRIAMQRIAVEELLAEFAALRSDSRLPQPEGE